MDEKYDVIVLGTGLKECILSGLMSSVAKKKVLHLDRNPYYGGESASLNLEQLWARFAPGKKIPEDLGKSREYAIDLCPKFLMACGKLVKILLKTKVTAYLEFRSVAGSYVYQKGKDTGKVFKIPTKPNDAFTSSLLTVTQKNKYRKMLQFIANYDKDNEKTHKKDLDLSKTTSKDLYDYFGLGDKSILFNGHAVALYRDDKYLDNNCQDLVSRCQMYANSVARYGSSPYIYPRYGLGGLPEGFSRRCAVHGGVYMLNCDKKENFVEKITYNEKDGTPQSVTVGGESAKCKILIGDPSYFVEEKGKVKEIGRVVRCICILDHPIKDTNNEDSCQIIIPGPECGRKTDIYICMSSYKHNIAAEGKYIAVCSATIEDEKYDEEKYEFKNDLGIALNLLGEIKHTFHWVSVCLDKAADYPSNKGGAGVYITSSYDATTHFENCCKEVLDIYEQIMGAPLDLELDQTEEIENEKIQ